MKTPRLQLIGLLVLPAVSLVLMGTAFGADESLKYTQPASQWTEALPVGNGRLGAMVFGGVAGEHLQLNEATLWSGGPRNWNNPGAKEILPQVRAAIFAGDYVKADQLCKKMQGPYNESYQPLGDLRLAFSGTDQTVPADYERTLDLDRAVVTERYSEGGATFTREVFSSYPDQVIVVRLMCDKPGRINFTATTDSLLHFNVTADGANGLVMSGTAPSHVDPSYLRSANPIRYDPGPNPEGMTFDLYIRAFARGGTVVCDGKSLTVANSDAVTLLLSAGTSFNGPDKSPSRDGRNPAAVALGPLDAAEKKSYRNLLARHIADYQKLFRRVEINLGETPGASDLIYRRTSGPICKRRSRSRLMRAAISIWTLPSHLQFQAGRLARKLARYLE